jgi:hypothetical protein
MRVHGGLMAPLQTRFPGPACITIPSCTTSSLGALARTCLCRASCSMGLCPRERGPRGVRWASTARPRRARYESPASIFTQPVHHVMNMCSSALCFYLPSRGQYMPHTVLLAQVLDLITCRDRTPPATIVLLTGNGPGIPGAGTQLATLQKSTQKSLGSWIRRLM